MQDRTTFGVVTYNIHDGRNPNKVIKNILDLIQMGADLICLQEIRLSYQGVDIRKLLTEQLPVDFKPEYFLGDDRDWYDYGLAIIWNAKKFSNTSFDKVALPLQEKIKLWDKPFYMIHGLQQKFFKRGALVGTFAIDHKRIRVSNIHLDFQGGDRHRKNQIEHLVAHLNSNGQTDCEIICGDFNTVGIFGKKSKFIMLTKLLGERFESVLTKPYNTATLQQLDYIFGKNTEVQNAKLLKMAGSDHYPLFAKVTIR